MKKNLLAIVKDILNDLDADNVNSISDTAESEQVAQIVRTCYEEMIANRNWPHLRKLFQLESYNNLARPNYLRIPLQLKELSSFAYEVQREGSDSIVHRDLKYKEPVEFLQYVSTRNSNNSNVKTIVDESGVKLLILDDQPPTYYTSFDDEVVITDSYDKVIDDALQKSKTRCVGFILPEWVHEDNHVPDLPPEAFPALVAEAKSTAFISVKQMANQKAEQKAARQQKWLSRKAWRVDGQIQYPNYGRK
jgi:hypothetical protein